MHSVIELGPGAEMVRLVADSPADLAAVAWLGRVDPQLLGAGARARAGCPRARAAWRRPPPWSWICPPPSAGSPAATAGQPSATATMSSPTPTTATIRVNLGPLCRQHHNAKTHGLWKLTYHPDTGVKTWTSPLGKTYTKSTDPPLT